MGARVNVIRIAGQRDWFDVICKLPKLEICGVFSATAKDLDTPAKAEGVCFLLIWSVPPHKPVLSEQMPASAFSTTVKVRAAYQRLLTF